MLELLARLKQLSSTSRGCTRVAYTELEDRAFDTVWQCLSHLPGLERIDDAAGNMFVVPAKAFQTDTPVVLIGSHLDTVIEGGWLDGTLGVAAGVHVLHTLSQRGAVDGVGLVVFRDEEGVRFNTGLFGSRVFSGQCSERDLDVSDLDGVRVHDVVRAPAGCLAYQPPVKPSCYLECHIEQGARLFESDARIGVVSGIVGIRRYRVESTGRANHAGTTDMTRRRDALVPTARLVGQLPDLVTDLDNAVLTCGQLTVHPGAPNVIPGSVSAIVESRAESLRVLDIIQRRLSECVGESSTRSPEVTMTLEPTVAIAPTFTDQHLVSELRVVLDRRQIRHVTLPSMAGHDAQNAARVCPSAMFFIPSIDGISHSPDENSAEGDITLAGDVMLDWAHRCQGS